RFWPPLVRSTFTSVRRPRVPVPQAFLACEANQSKNVIRAQTRERVSRYHQRRKPAQGKPRPGPVSVAARPLIPEAPAPPTGPATWLLCVPYPRRAQLQAVDSAAHLSRDVIRSRRLGTLPGRATAAAGTRDGSPDHVT